MSVTGSALGAAYDWDDVLSELPASADATAVRAMAEAALSEYQCLAAAPMRELWQQLAHHAQSKSVEKICDLIRRIGPPDPELPDPGFIGALAPTSDWLPRLGHELTTLPQVAAAIADLYKPKERLIFRLCRAWPDKLSISNEGPLTRFIQKILDPLSNDATDGETIKKAVERVRPRRLIFASAVLSAKGNLICDSEEPSKPAG